MFINRIKELLCQDKMPVWMTLAGILIGAIGTYTILPSINQTFERQKIKTEFVIRNLDNINVLTRSLLSDVSKLHKSSESGLKPNQSDIAKVGSIITELQWKAIELSVIFDGVEDGKFIESYQQSIDEVRMYVMQIENEESVQKSAEAIEKFARISTYVMKRLLNISGIDVKARSPKN